MSGSRKFLIIPSKTATLWVAVLRGNPSPFLENGLPRQSADWLAMTGFQQNVKLAAGLRAHVMRPYPMVFQIKQVRVLFGI